MLKRAAGWQWAPTGSVPGKLETPTPRRNRERAAAGAPEDEGGPSAGRGAGKGPPRPGTSRSRLASPDHRGPRGLESVNRLPESRRARTRAHLPRGERGVSRNQRGAKAPREPSFPSRKSGRFRPCGARVLHPPRPVCTAAPSGCRWQRCRGLAAVLKSCCHPACTGLSGWLQMGRQQGRERPCKCLGVPRATGIEKPDTAPQCAS